MDFMFKLLHLWDEEKISLFQKAGYDDNAIQQLIKGGFSIISSDMLNDERFISLRYSSDFDIFSQHADWESLGPEISKIPAKYFICDTYYARVYGSLPLKKFAIYGDKENEWVLLEIELEKKSSLRVYHRGIPAFLVHSIADLKQILKSLHEYNSKLLYLFRGQPEEYLLNRPKPIKEFLFGNATEYIREPSLLSQAARKQVDADEILGLLHIEFQDFLYQADSFKERVEEIAKTMGSKLYFSPSYTNFPHIHSSFARRKESGSWLRELMALSQHYGIPTYGLDLTKNLDVAVWFALNNLKTKKSGCYTYEPVLQTENKLQGLPCIYFFGLPDWKKEHFAVLDMIKSEATRPKRQDAFLSFGGWGWHQNIVAEDLMTVAYLAPDFKIEKPFDADWLFPKPKDDPFYKLILDRKRSLPETDVLRKSLYKYVLEYDFSESL